MGEVDPPTCTSSGRGGLLADGALIDGTVAAADVGDGQGPRKGNASLDERCY